MPKKQIWTPAKMCEHCGRIILLLRHKTWTPENRHWVCVYAKGWEGDPWFRGADRNSSVRMHPKWHWPTWLLEHPPSDEEPPDPFFSLD